MRKLLVLISIIATIFILTPSIMHTDTKTSATSKLYELAQTNNANNKLIDSYVIVNGKKYVSYDPFTTAFFQMLRYLLFGNYFESHNQACTSINTSITGSITIGNTTIDMFITHFIPPSAPVKIPIPLIPQIVTQAKICLTSLPVVNWSIDVFDKNILPPDSKCFNINYTTISNNNATVEVISAPGEIIYNGTTPIAAVYSLGINVTTKVKLDNPINITGIIYAVDVVDPNNMSLVTIPVSAIALLNSIYSSNLTINYLFNIYYVPSNYTRVILDTLYSMVDVQLPVLSITGTTTIYTTTTAYMPTYQVIQSFSLTDAAAWLIASKLLGLEVPLLFCNMSISYATISKSSCVVDSSALSTALNVSIASSYHVPTSIGSYPLVDIMLAYGYNAVSSSTGTSFTVIPGSNMSVSSFAIVLSDINWTDSVYCGVSVSSYSFSINNIVSIVATKPISVPFNPAVFNVTISAYFVNAITPRLVALYRRVYVYDYINSSIAISKIAYVPMAMIPVPIGRSVYGFNLEISITVYQIPTSIYQ